MGIKCDWMLGEPHNEKKLKFSVEILIKKMLKVTTNVQISRKPLSVTYQTIYVLKTTDTNLSKNAGVLMWHLAV